MRIGILGGTFDPIHIAHLHAGETALASGRLDRLLFMPAGDPWQKGDRTVTSKADRLAMVELAIREHDGFLIDRREIDRNGPTYTIETLESFPLSDDLLLVMGADTALGLATWHRHEEVLDRARLLVVPRPGIDATHVLDEIPGAELLQMASLGVSGTMIREMAGDGRPYRYLVPEPVYEYINEKNLYAKHGFGDMVEETTEMESSS